VIRDKILSNVLFPAPLRPMMPMTSPCLTSKETSFKAQIVSDFGLRIAEFEFDEPSTLEMEDGGSARPFGFRIADCGFRISKPPERRHKSVCQRIAEGAVGFALTDAVEFRKAFDFDGYVSHN